MKKFRIRAMHATGLWNERDVSVEFNEDVNILIGPNGSGKTTILKLLQFVLTPDVDSLSEIVFKDVVISLQAFDSHARKTIRVKPVEGGLQFRVSLQTYSVVAGLSHNAPGYRVHRLPDGRLVRRSAGVQDNRKGLEAALTGLVPGVWLPVNRRLPVSQDEDEIRTWARGERPSLESVDECLRNLLQQLQGYRLILETRLSEQYKEFERKVLQNILYSRAQDSKLTVNLSDLPTEEEKQMLLRAFEKAGLLDERMKGRIDEHFFVAQEVLRKLQKSPKAGLTWEDMTILPLIPRTKAMVNFAQEMEEYRLRLFSPLEKYQETVNSFLHGKSIRVSDEGELLVSAELAPDRKYSPYRLSSGEKQILILLTQALLKEGQPVVYVADEPELSLHVTWQEKLLESIVELGRPMQIIVATHSPDIVGPYGDKVIDLGTGS